jgi:hypothetical protein
MLVISSLACSTEASNTSQNASVSMESESSSEIVATSIEGVVNKNANLREGPGTDYKVVGGVKIGRKVRIVGRNDAGDWYLLDNQTWVAAFLIDGKPDIPVVQQNEASSKFYIGNLAALISNPVEEVEAILGKPAIITPFAAGDMAGYSEAGETRNYSWNTYSLLGYYSTANILKGIQIEGGLSDKGYKITDWSVVIASVDLPNSILPDVIAPAAVRWNNLDGYKVIVFADGIQDDSVIWTIQIWAIE